MLSGSGTTGRGLPRGCWSPRSPRTCCRRPTTAAWDGTRALAAGQLKFNAGAPDAGGSLLTIAATSPLEELDRARLAMQDDYMKRVRDGGGARDQLRAEGIVIFGDYAGDQLLASALDLPRPGPGEFVSARLARRREDHDAYTRSVRLDGADWLLASAADPAGPAPALPR